MGLTASEIVKIKAELGYNVLTTGSPYVDSYLYLFEQIIQPFVDEQGETTSNTAIVSSTAPTPVTLALADASDVPVGATVIIDVDSRQERVTVQSKSGNSITVLLTKPHSGTYPVAVESGVTVVRDLLARIAEVKTTIAALRSRVGLKKVEDIELFGGGSTLASQGIDPLTQVLELREQWRDELASALGVDRLNGENSSGGSSISVY